MNDSDEKVDKFSCTEAIILSNFFSITTYYHEKNNLIIQLYGG